MPQTIYLVDGHAQLYMAFHALDALTAPDGTPTGAVFGFVRIIQKLINRHAPTGMVVTFDSPGKTFRHERFAAYKANRPPMPDELRTQLELAKRVLASWPIAVREVPGFEADDVLATLARRLRGPDRKIVIVTSDKDARQLLVEGEVELFDTRKERFLTERTLLAEHGLEARQVPDYLALVGDASDNVPGVRLVGPVKAKALLQRYGDLAGVLDHAEEVGGKTGTSLAESRAGATEALALCTLSDQAPLEISIEDVAFGAPDPTELAPLFNRLGFYRLATEMFGRAANGEPAGVPAAEVAVDPDSPPLPESVRVVATDEDLAAFEGELAGAHGAVALDLAWEGDPRAGHLVGAGVCAAEGPAWYLPLDAADVELPVARRRQLLVALATGTIPLACFGAKEHVHTFAGAGLSPPAFAFDVRLAAHLLASSQTSSTLAQVAQSHLGVTLEDAGRPAPSLFDEIVLADNAIRVGRRAAAVQRLERILSPCLEARGLQALHDALELPLAPVLARMEARGIGIDVAALATLGRELASAIALESEAIRAAAGREFNVDSPRQLAQVLYGDLGLPSTRKTPGGEPSTDSGALEELSELHPLPSAVLRYRQMVKLQNTYVEALPRQVDPTTGRIHTRFESTGSATGRLSSADPNLQNIPVRTPLGRAIREAFVAGPNAVLMSADYSQVELRILAHASGDEALLAAFRAGEDVHRAVAARVFAVREDEVDSDQRRRAKTVNFGILYGQSAFGLARELEISRDEAKAFIERYFDRFSRVREYVDAVIAGARARGYVTTLEGRPRPLPEIRSPIGHRRQFAERAAVNTVIQGTAADLIKRAMIAVDREIARRGLPARLLLSIHDELVLELDPACASELAGVVAPAMSGAMSLVVPLDVSIGVGANWLAAGQSTLYAPA